MSPLPRSPVVPPFPTSTVPVAMNMLPTQALLLPVKKVVPFDRIVRLPLPEMFPASVRNCPL